MEFKSYADLEADVVRLLPRLPRDLDLIVAIPRSGMVPATMIALHLNLPLTDLTGLYEHRLIASGHRSLRSPLGGVDQKPLNVLIVDDSVGTGAQLREIRAQLAASALPHRIEVAVIYATPSGKPLVDYYAETVPMLRHFFAWNVMHHNAIATWCVDIDGVLCRDCTPAEDDDGDHYARFLDTVEPLFIPTGKVGWLVTGRLEKHRAATENWLHRHGVVYDHLEMFPAQTVKQRQAMGGGGPYKGAFYKRVDAGLFIESNQHEAQTIANIAAKPVLCLDTRTMFKPGRSMQLRKFATKGPGAYLRYIRRLFGNMQQYRQNVAATRYGQDSAHSVIDFKQGRNDDSPKQH